MANFKADMGLLESWSGFKSSVEKEVAIGAAAPQAPSIERILGPK